MLQFFLAKGGTALIQISCKPEEFCQENDIAIKSVSLSGGIAYVHVDASKIVPNTFYTFNEEDTQAFEVWRTFVFIEKDAWNINSSLDAISLSGFKVSTLAEAVLRNVTNIKYEL
jgi:hypothetical protein